MFRINERVISCCSLLSSYENPLVPIDCISSEFDLCSEKRHLFEFANPHCDLDLDEYKYEDDFE